MVLKTSKLPPPLSPIKTFNFAKQPIITPNSVQKEWANEAFAQYRPTFSTLSKTIHDGLVHNSEDMNLPFDYIIDNIPNFLLAKLPSFCSPLARIQVRT